MSKYTQIPSKVCPAVLAVMAGVAIPSQLEAGIIGSVWQNVPQSIADVATLANAAALGTPDAQFSPTAINYDTRVTGATLNKFLGFPAFSNQSATFDPNQALTDGGDKNTFFYFTGDTYLNAGDNNFLVPHDDGLQLNIDGIGLVVDKPDPTAPVVTPFTVHAPAAGFYHFELSYAEDRGEPAVLAFQVNGKPIGNVPDGGATLMLLGMGMSSLALLRRR